MPAPVLANAGLNVTSAAGVPVSAPRFSRFRLRAWRQTSTQHPSTAADAITMIPDIHIGIDDPTPSPSPDKAESAASPGSVVTSSAPAGSVTEGAVGDAVLAAAGEVSVTRAVVPATGLTGLGVAAVLDMALEDGAEVVGGRVAGIAVGAMVGCVVSSLEGDCVGNVVIGAVLGG